jgi:ribosomal protein L11 methyltransferase
MPQSANPAFLQPFPIGDRFTVVPEISRSKTGDRVPIILGPGRAFGSGRHETTISCIEAMENLKSLSGKKVLDVGTGTGILAIAAALLDADEVIALDIEREATSACRGNAILNRVEDRIRILCGTLDSIAVAREYHLIFANIYGDIILANTSDLAARLRPNGFLILSGIDYTDSTPLRILFGKEGLEERSTTFGRDYVTQVWVNPQDRSPGPPEGV